MNMVISQHKEDTSTINRDGYDANSAFQPINMVTETCGHGKRQRKSVELNHNQAKRLYKCFELHTFKAARRQTFSHWNAPLKIKKQMIEAGFFHCNVADRVICVYCGLICHKWQYDTDNPIETHKILSPTCPYVLMKSTNRDKLFNQSNEHESENPSENNQIQTSQTSLSYYDHSLIMNDQPTQPMTEQILSRLVAARLDLPISQSLLKQNFKLSVVKRCWEDQLRLKNADFPTSCDLYIACLVLQKQIDYINGDKNKIIEPSVKLRELQEQQKTVIHDAVPELRPTIPTDDISNKVNNASTKTVSTIQSSVTGYEDEKERETTVETTLTHPCTICSREQKQLACIPCSHLAICVKCSHQIRMCPICNKSVDAFVRIYI